MGQANPISHVLSIQFSPGMVLLNRIWALMHYSRERQYRCGDAAKHGEGHALCL